jgi:xylulokinase
MTNKQLVAGVDSSTQSVKIVLCDIETGEIKKTVTRPHPDGTEVDPNHWLSALEDALAEASNFAEISAIAIGGQQHGMVLLDENGQVIRPALLWNDTRSDKTAADLNAEFPDIAKLTGSQLVASFTAAKVRWVAEHEPENIAKVAAICLPHDWLSWKLTGSSNLNDLFTDRSDASGTGYFNPTTNEYLPEILKSILKSDRKVVLPRIISANEFGAKSAKGIPIAAGCGDNAGAALGINSQIGDMVISLGTSGTAFISTKTATHDKSGEVAGFADATGNFLPLACTLNAAKIFATVAKTLNLSFEDFSQAALSAPIGANGLRLITHFDGERTPNKPNATGSFYGITHENFTSANIARAAIEGVIAGMRYAAEAIAKLNVPINRVILVGGAARNQAVQEVAATFFDYEIAVPEPGEYVALGAARQAAWALSGSDTPPNWNVSNFKIIEKKANSHDLYLDYERLIRG